MPEAVREIFEDFVARDHDNEEMSRSWKKVQDEIRELISSGLISGQELNHAKLVAVENSSDKEVDELDEVVVNGAA